jgi:small subunit ribosomal protein S1
MPTTLEPTATGTSATDRAKRDAQRAQLRPLANRRPELYDEDEYQSEA